MWPSSLPIKGTGHLGDGSGDRSVADEGEVIHDVRRQLELEQRLLKQSTKAIAVADHNRLTSLDDRVLQRVESDVLSRDLSNHLHSVAWRVRSRYPTETLRLLGLDTMPDRQVPRAVLGAAINVHERLLRPDPAFVPRPGREPLDFPALAAELWEMVELVDAGLQAHAETREAAASALAERRAAPGAARPLLWHLASVVGAVVSLLVFLRG